MVIPAILGAMVLKIADLPGDSGGIGLGPVLLGTVTAAVVGYLGLKWLIRLTVSGHLYLFAYYLWALGIVVIVGGLF
jgi:undecaprenyl-diphosphatase